MEIQSCKFCNIINAAEENIFSDKETERIIKEIFSGKITVKSLDVNTYEKVAKHLTAGVYEGYGKDMLGVKFGEPDFKMLQSLRENVYVFSAAKSYQQTKEMSALLLDGDKKKPFNEFKKEAKTVFEKYNKHYLAAEYNSAIAQARSASMWQDFEKEKKLYDQLQYQTVGDGRVRQEHRVLDGIIRPVNDKFWSIYMPPNGWNCRCTVIQTTGEVITDLGTKRKPTQKEVPEIFRFNPGKEKIIFSKSHPYFNVAKAERELALNNFNLPLPKEIAPVPGAFIPAKTTLEAEQRMIEAGVKNVSLKGLNADLANAVLQAVEKESGIGNFSVESITTFSRSNSNAKAMYYPHNNSIKINLSHLNTPKQVLLSYEEQLVKARETIQKFKVDFVGKPQYPQSSVDARIRSLNSRVREIEQKILKGETPRFWSMSSSVDSGFESLKSTVTHELGHYRHFKTLNNSTDFIWTRGRSVTEYGGTNRHEYFAEWFTHYRLKGEAGVPEDMIKLFKTIGNGK